MSASAIQATLREIERGMAKLAPYRAPVLFHEFLVQGYTAITLSSVPPERFSDLLRAKLCLGTLITLYDDFADRPATSDPQLLKALYRLTFGQGGSGIGTRPQDQRALAFARSLFAEIEDILQRQPHYHHLREILAFDLAQFYSANQFSSLLTAQPYLRNTLENRLYAHHNMGMVMAAMIDLMAVENLELSELGATREIFLLGQRMGRIFNVLATHQREVSEGDITGELATFSTEREIARARRGLKSEIFRLDRTMRKLGCPVTSFSVPHYADGLMRVRKLHERMKGAI